MNWTLLIYIFDPLISSHIKTKEERKNVKAMNIVRSDS